MLPSETRTFPHPFVHRPVHRCTCTPRPFVFSFSSSFFSLPARRFLRSVLLRTIARRRTPWPRVRLAAGMAGRTRADVHGRLADGKVRGSCVYASRMDVQDVRRGSFTNFLPTTTAMARDQMARAQQEVDDVRTRGKRSHAVDGSSARTSAVFYARLTRHHATHVACERTARRACSLVGTNEDVADRCVNTHVHVRLCGSYTTSRRHVDGRARMQLDVGRYAQVQKVHRTAKSRPS